MSARREHRKRKAERERQALIVDEMKSIRPPWRNIPARIRYKRGKYVLLIDKERYYSNDKRRTKRSAV